MVRRDGAKTLTADWRPCAARLQRSLFPPDRLARAPGRSTPLAVQPLPRGRARPGRLYRSVGALSLQKYHHHLCRSDPGDTLRSRDHDRHFQPIAAAFLSQIKGEFETNEYLKSVSPMYTATHGRSVPMAGPRNGASSAGLRLSARATQGATIEAHGLIDGQPTSRHFQLHIYDDVVTQDYLSEESIRKTTERWELADNPRLPPGRAQVDARNALPLCRYMWSGDRAQIAQAAHLSRH